MLLQVLVDDALLFLLSVDSESVMLMCVSSVRMHTECMRNDQGPPIRCLHP